jgi:phospholipid/cholesterol/gamma-HCH transport system ATP-binding protein
MLLATIPSFHGYYMKGGALEVGKASTLCLDIGFYNIIQLYINAIVTRIMIEIKDIEKSFGGTKILKGISTIFETGKRTIGQSGSGKTVLLKVFRNPYPESGKICFDGRVYSELEPDEKRTPHRNRNGFQGSAYLIR